jgi:hypothetical protein
MLLKFPTLAASGVNTVVAENGVMCRKLIVYLRFTNQNLWLKCKGYFVQSLVGNHQQKCLICKQCKLFTGAGSICKSKRPGK